MMIEYVLAFLGYVLCGGVIAFTQRGSINESIESKGLQSFDRTLYAFIVLVWPAVVLGELSARVENRPRP